MSDDSWDEDSEEFIQKIGNVAGAYNWIHNYMGTIYTIINYMFHILVMIITAPLVAGPLATIAEDSDLTPVKVVISAIAIVIGIISGVHVYLKLPAKISAHRAAAMQFSTIFMRVQKELIKKAKHRSPLSMFSDEILEDYNECYNESPGVLKLIIKRYIKLLPDGIDLTYEDLVGVMIIRLRDENDDVRKPKVIVGKARMQYELERHFIST